MSNITVRQLIEHLAQFDPDLQVKLVDPAQPLVLFDIGEHDVRLEEFTTQLGFPRSTTVVAIG